MYGNWTWSMCFLNYCEFEVWEMDKKKGLHFAHLQMKEQKAEIKLYAYCPGLDGSKWLRTA